MRIAYLTQSYPPMLSGAAISAEQTAESMAQHGHQVLVIAASDREYPYHTYKQNITVMRLSSLRNPLRVGQRLILRPRRAIQFLKQFEPDIIHAHEPIQMGMLAIGYAIRTRTPLTITAHQLPWFVASYLPEAFRPGVEKILWAFARLILNRYTSVIAPTQTIATIIEQQTGIKPKVISHGLDLGIFHPPLSSRPETATHAVLNIPVNVPIILHVGRLDIDKRVDRVIHAAAQPIRESDAHLLIVGDGCQKYHLVRLCKELGIERRVHFTGFLPPACLPDIYRIGTMFVTASEIETQGIVLLEAAASGLPIIAANATCISEIVHDHRNGFLIEPRNIPAFSDAITSLLDNPEYARIMGLESRKLAEEHDLKRAWTLHEKIYLEMMGHRYADYGNRGVKLARRWDIIKNLIEWF